MSINPEIRRILGATVDTELRRISGAKTNIRDAIARKGVNVPITSRIDEYAAFIDQINGVGEWQSVTLESGFNCEIARWRTIDFGRNVQLQLKNITGPSSLSFPANICHLPYAALPAEATFRGISPGTGNNYSRYEISPWDGYVKWYNEYPSYGSGHWIDIQCIYPVTTAQPV